ncbi:uncharacterized protein LOC116197349 [Punica granatum]|uniref:Uncharacterized protein n=2 Tax=Punica granatum TaxID=22663 RepID=A0A2I0K6I3_PUNGR|nr:uncharacterized protein LOC116197349 [Punica granatum]PKI63733.1 hypothetical protein CRG98_015854 [Punica granatum]
MASSASNLFPTYHIRSISLPSRPNPFILNVDEHTRRLALYSETTTASSSSLLSSRLGELRDLYDSVDALLELPRTQQLFAHGSHKDRVDGLLASSLCFLDVCGIAKDALLQTKEQLQDLQSVLRRKRGDESELIKESAKYLSSRKMSKKAISKSLRDLKSKCSNLSSSEHEPNTEATFGKLRQVEMVSVDLFSSLLSFLSEPTAQSKTSSWALLSKLVYSSKHISYEGEPTKSSEFKNVDSMLQTLIDRKMRKNISIEKEGLQNELRRLESSIQDLEEELESVVRRIIRTRAYLLNLLTN